MLLASVQVGAATISGVLAARWFGGLGVTAASVFVTIVLFIYAEALPKTRAVRHPQANALRVTPVLRLLVTVFRPPVTVLLRLADLQTRGEAAFDAASEAELRSLAKEAAEAGEIEPGDAVLVERSFRFGDTHVDEVMVPRADIRWVGRDEDVATALARALEHGHRRLPVVGRDLDDVVGFVRLRDVAAAARVAPERTAGAATQKVLRVGPDEPIADVLGRMQSGRSRLAVVVDARGRTVGLVTIEDIVAELVGEIAEDGPTPGGRG
mgnify:CR=1 FL=1